MYQPGTARRALRRLVAGRSAHDRGLLFRAQPVVHPGRRVRALPVPAPQIRYREPAVLGRGHEEAGALGGEGLGERAHDGFGQLLAGLEHAAKREQMRLRVAQRLALQRALDQGVQLASFTRAPDRRERPFPEATDGGGPLARQSEDDDLRPRARLVEGVEQREIRRKQGDVPPFRIGQPLWKGARVHHVREAVTTALQLRAFARAADDQDPTRHGLPPTSSIPEWSNRRAARTAPFVPGASRGSARRQVCETHLRGAPCLLESGTGVRIERTELRNVHHPIP